MDITTSQMQGRVPVTVFHVQGVVDSASYQKFTATLREAIENGAEYLLLDLAGVYFMSSAGIRSLNEISLFLRQKFPQEPQGRPPVSKHVKLLNPRERVLDVLKVSGVDAFFEIHANLEQAVASF
jgi:anti-anti-sigma factor